METYELEYDLASDHSYSNKTLCYKLVSVFSGIVGKKIFLKDSFTGVARTDGSMIEVPLKDKNNYEHTEHELSHILFKSSAIAAIDFKKEYSEKVESIVLKRKGDASFDAYHFRSSLDSIMGILDDERVISLWGTLYKGSEIIQRKMKHEQARSLLPIAHKNIINLLYLMAANHDVKPGKLDRYKPYLIEALLRVRYSDYYGVLTTTKWLVSKLLIEMIREKQGKAPYPCNQKLNTPSLQMGKDSNSDSSKEIKKESGEEGDVPSGEDDSHVLWNPEDDVTMQEKADAFNDMVNGILHKSSGEKKLDLSYQVESKYKSTYDEEAARNMVKAAMSLDVNNNEKIESALSKSKKVMNEITQKAKQAFKTSQDVQEDDRLKNGCFSKIIFKDIKQNENVIPIVYDGDAEVIRRLKALFIKVMGKNQYKSHDEGAEINVPLYINRRIGGGDAPVFMDSVTGRGFQSILLIDRSSSMEGKRTQLAERGCRIISKSLKFPFVDLAVWGFQGRDNGVVITRFERNKEVFDSPDAEVYGNTPLHVALRAAVNALLPGSKKKHIFILTDGHPTHSNSNNIFGRKTLMKFIAATTKDARSRGIGVTCFAIDDAMPDKDLSMMFGSHHWSKITEKNISTGMVDLVSSSFIRYLSMR